MQYSGRRRVVLIGLGCVVAALLWRAVDLQLTHKEFLQDHGDARHLRLVTMPAHRGMITDRNGEPLAISTPVNSVWATPGKLIEEKQNWASLAEILGTTEAHLKTIIEPRLERNFVYLKRQVSPQLAERVASLGLNGVGLVKEYRRYYPTSEVTAHVVGFTNVDDEGQEGIELALDPMLKGVSGAKRVVKDRLGRIVENVESIRAPTAGEDVVLSIDKRVQYVAYRELKAAVFANRARAGSIVVVDARTGEILALANQPSFNPNNRGDLKGEYYRNRAVTDVFEPGSTIKPFTIAAALETGAFDPHSQVDTRPGFFSVGHHTIRDLHDYGLIDVAGVIEKSSNVGASKIALSLDSRLLWEALSLVGFGVRSDVGFAGETSGQLNDYRNWREIEHATIAYGYGLSVSSLQLARAYCVLANDGVAVPVTIQRVSEAPLGQRIFSAQTVSAVRDMLEAAVERGTGRLAAVPGYRVAGKTGTVHKTTTEGYSEDRYIALFAGMVPASQPRLVAVVVIDEPQGGEHFGGRVAAPVFAQVMTDALRLLNVPPDDMADRYARTVALHTPSSEAKSLSVDSR
jgi:cell division protein FtsI (penicillin-binding protein 3)